MDSVVLGTTVNIRGFNESEEILQEDSNSKFMRLDISKEPESVSERSKKKVLDILGIIVKKRVTEKNSEFGKSVTVEKYEMSPENMRLCSLYNDIFIEGDWYVLVIPIPSNNNDLKEFYVIDAATCKIVENENRQNYLKERIQQNPAASVIHVYLNISKTEKVINDFNLMIIPIPQSGTPFNEYKIPRSESDIDMLSNTKSFVTKTFIE